MGIQTTINVTRKEAIKKYAEQRIGILEKQAMVMDDKDLEDSIEEKFYNYNIIGE